jgi:hypothetical protein
MPVAVAAAVAVGASVYSANRQAKAAKEASKIQAQSADAGVAEQQRQFDAIQELLAPFVEAGQPALAGQMDLVGLNGTQAQKTAIAGIENSPQFGALVKQGENAILQNASATGGLRGGDVQGALAQFRPEMLASLINEQYAKLGGLTTLGQNSAVMQGNFGQQAANNVTDLLQQRGSALAGGALARGKEQAGYASAISSGVGMYGGLGGFGSEYSKAFQGMYGKAF